MCVARRPLRRLETDHLDLSQFHDELYKSTLKHDRDLGRSQHGYAAIVSRKIA
jgi:hypothetical protein